MKKALVLLMTVAMMFCFTATAFAATFSDMDNASTAVQNAVSKCSALEIINGYEDGTFKPEATITRAEFAKMACIAAGLKTSGEALGNTTSTFSDVKAGEWYTGWISLANSKGFVRGYEDGTFKPNQTISNQEVVTVLMRMLGYTDALAGPWPIDYINQAAKLDVMDDVSFTGSAAALRGDVAVMVSNTLDCYMVEYSKDIEDFAEKTKSKVVTTYRTIANPDWVPGGASLKPEDPNYDKKQFVEIKDGSTTVNEHYKLLEDSFDGSVEENILLDNWGVKSYSKDIFTIGTPFGTFEATLDGTAFNGDNTLFGSIGHRADVFYTKDSNNKYTAKYIEVTSKEVKGSKISVDGKKVKLDGKTYSVTSDDVLTTVKGLPACNLEYTIYVNDDNEVYAATSDANAKKDNVKFVKEVNANNKKITYLGSGSANLKDKDYIIIKDGKVADFAAVEAGKAVKDRGSDVYEVMEPKTGKLQSYSDTKVKIDGVSYATKNLEIYDADFSKLTTPKDYINTEVQYVVNANNGVYTLMAKEEGTSSTLYGVVTKLSLASGSRGETEDYVDTLTIFDSKGVETRYNVKSEIAYVDNTPKDKATVTVGSFIEYKLDANNTVKSITVMDQLQDDEHDYDVSGTVKTDDKNNRIELSNGTKYTVPENTPIFNIQKDGDNTIKVELLSRSSVINGDNLEFSAIDFTTATDLPRLLQMKIDGSRAVAIAVTEANTDSGIKYGIINDLNGYNEDDDRTITFFGDDKEYVLKDGALTTGTGDGGFAQYDLVSYKLSGNDVTEVGTATATGHPAVHIKDIKVTDTAKITSVSVDDGLLKSDKQYSLMDDTLYLEYDKTGNSIAVSVLGTGNDGAGNLDTDDYVFVGANDDKEAQVVIRVIFTADELKPAN